MELILSNFVFQLAKSIPYNLQFSTNYNVQMSLHKHSGNRETERLEKMLAWMPGSHEHDSPAAEIDERSFYGGKM
eukprot:749846-Hanusia_phi.AAC.2